MKLYIDYSTLAEFKLCPQKFVYNSLLNLAQASTEALDFGTLIHFGTELLGMANVSKLPSLQAIDNEIDFLTSNNPPCPSQVEDTLLRTLHYVADETTKYPTIFQGIPTQRRSLKHALTLLARYALHYYPEPLKLNAFESQLEAYLGRVGDVEVYYRGTRDGIGDDFILERKTTSYLGTSFIDLVNPNNQATGYIWLEQTLGNDLNRVIFDGISTSGYGGYKNAKYSDPSKWEIYKNPSSLFLRTETTRTPSQVAEWKSETLASAKALYDTIAQVMEKDSNVTKNAPQACNAWNSPCPYKTLCQNPPESRANLLSIYTKKPKWKGFCLEDNSGNILFGSKVTKEEA